MSSVNSPFRYAGGKFYARKLILEHMQPHRFYIEPFAGGGSIFFAKEKVADNWLNDFDKELVNVYEVIRDRSEDLIAFLKRRPSVDSLIPDEFFDNVDIGDVMPATKALHGFFKTQFRPRDALEEAGRWYYLNRTSYSGIMNLQNMYWGYGDKFSMQPRNWPRNIERTSHKLQDVKLTSLDFEEVIDKAPDGAFLFIDPPYYGADQDKFYRCAFLKEDHLRLKTCLERNSHRVNMFITYDNIEEVRNMYAWMLEMHDKEWNYCIQRTDDQKNKTIRKGERYKGRELFILNYESMPEQLKFIQKLAS